MKSIVPHQGISVLSGTCNPLSPFLCSQTHYRQEAMVALLSPQTKQKKEAGVAPFIISIWERFQL